MQELQAASSRHFILEAKVIADRADSRIVNERVHAGIVYRLHLNRVMARGESRYVVVSDKGGIARPVGERVRRSQCVSCIRREKISGNGVETITDQFNLTKTTEKLLKSYRNTISNFGGHRCY